MLRGVSGYNILTGPSRAVAVSSSRLHMREEGWEDTESDCEYQIHTHRVPQHLKPTHHLP